MLNLGKEKFISKNNFKRSFQMTLMTVENLVYNKLARQKISCFINAISSLVILIYCYHYYYYFLSLLLLLLSLLLSLLFLLLLSLLLLLYCYYSHHYYCF